MLQSILVYIIIALALGGLGRHIFRKIRILRKSKDTSECSSCPLKNNCVKKREMN